MQNTPAVVAPYTGQNQQTQIQVPDTIVYKSYQYSPEEGCWAMMPYQFLYPQPPTETNQLLPPPIQTTRLWDAMQTWPI